jgi:hypothetical protein
MPVMSAAKLHENLYNDQKNPEYCPVMSAAKLYENPGFTGRDKKLFAVKN